MPKQQQSKFRSFRMATGDLLSALSQLKYSYKNIFEKVVNCNNV